MMQPDSLTQLVGSGNTRTVEEEWLRVFDAPDGSLADLAEYHSVLGELSRTGRQGEAAGMAWAAIETLSSRHGPKDLLDVASPFLLAVGDHDELRTQVTAIYESAFADREGAETLLQEAGIAGGRPVRRALRTLDVCFQLKEGDYLASRDEDKAARVDKIDRSKWEFTITTDDGVETLGAVYLADGYRPARSTDFRVLRQFAPEELTGMLNDDPASVVIDICRQHGDKIDSDRLKDTLVPDVMSENAWKKWWPRARTALKRSPNIIIEGRSPYHLSYQARGVSAEESFLSEFRRHRDPVKQYELIVEYIRECREHNASPDKALRTCYEALCERGRALTTSGSPKAAAFWLVARFVGETAAIDGASEKAVDYFRSLDQFEPVFKLIDSAELADLGCTCVVEAKPDTWADHLMAVLPWLPLKACDKAATRLVEAGKEVGDFEPVIEQILASPTEHFEAFLWLWDGPTDEDKVVAIRPVTVFMRILRALEDARLSDSLPKEVLRRMSTRARSVFSARGFARFLACIDGIDSGMAKALRTQLLRSETLAVTVRDKLLKLLDQQFPVVDEEPEVPLWKRDDILLVTAAGMKKKQAEVDEHVNVKMKENARAIGRAAEHGDLSENAEYKFALEERDLLRSRLAQMNDELAMAKVIGPEDVPSEEIGVGTRAVFERTSDASRYEMTFVGPWEADLGAGLFNYRAPLAQSLMGARVGDVFEFDHGDASGSHKLIELHNSLAH